MPVMNMVFIDYLKFVERIGTILIIWKIAFYNHNLNIIRKGLG